MTLLNPQPLVVALVADGVHPFELGVACELFGIDRSDLTPNWYRFAVASDRPRARTAHGLSLSGLSPLAIAARAHTIVIPGWEALERPPPPSWLKVIQSAARRGARLISFCSGSFALAHAGVLRRATTHWMFAERFRRTFPDVELDTRPLWVRDGNVWAAAGTAAAIDCGLAVVAHDFGQRLANDVARRMVAPPVRAGDQAQYVDQALPPERDALEPARKYVLAHLAERHRIEALAKRCAMSPRTFARRFVATMGTSPWAWVKRQRLTRARELLETHHSWSITEIAQSVGVEPLTLRLAFKAQLKLTPTQYRRTFGL